MTPRQLRQHLRMILSNVLDFDIDVMLADYDGHNPPKAPWQDAYERCFPQVAGHAINLEIEYPREFSGNYGRDILALYTAVAAAEYEDPHRLPHGVACPEKTGWYHACVYASSKRVRAVHQYVMFIGLDAKAFGEDMSPPYVMVVGTERRLTLDMVASWGVRLPAPGVGRELRNKIANDGDVILSASECVAFTADGPEYAEVRDAAMSRIQQAAAKAKKEANDG